MSSKEMIAKLSLCPLCGSKEDCGYEGCFHCSGCIYHQCMDYDGFYDRHKSAKKEATNE